MRRLLFIFLFLFLATSSFAQDPSSFIDRNEVDEFTGKKVVLSKTSEIPVLENTGGEKVKLAGGYVAHIEGSYVLVIDVQSEGWNFLNSDTAYFIVDGKRYEKTLQKGESEMDTEGMNVSLYERLLVRLNDNFRDRLENATKVRMKAGSVVFNLTPAVDDEIWAVEETVNGDT